MPRLPCRHSDSSCPWSLPRRELGRERRPQLIAQLLCFLGHAWLSCQCQSSLPRLIYYVVIGLSDTSSVRVLAIMSVFTVTHCKQAKQHEDKNIGGYTIRPPAVFSGVGWVLRKLRILSLKEECYNTMEWIEACRPPCSIRLSNRCKANSSPRDLEDESVSSAGDDHSIRQSSPAEAPISWTRRRLKSNPVVAGEGEVFHEIGSHHVVLQVEEGFCDVWPVRELLKNVALGAVLCHDLVVVLLV